MTDGSGLPRGRDTCLYLSKTAITCANARNDVTATTILMVIQHGGLPAAHCPEAVIWAVIGARVDHRRDAVYVAISQPRLAILIVRIITAGNAPAPHILINRPHGG